MGVLDLQPRGAAAVALIGTLRPFGDDALEITIAGELVQTRPTRTNCIEEHQAGLDARHDARETPFTFYKRQRAQIFVVDRQRIKRQEVRPRA